MKKILPVDVIHAGICYSLPDKALAGFEQDYTSDGMRYYKNILTESGAKLTISYRKEFGYLCVRISLPKMIYGTNVETFYGSDVDKAISKVNSILLGEQIYADFSDFKIFQMELSHNYVCHSKSEKLRYLNTFKSRRLSRKSNRAYPTSMVYKNKSSRLTIYDKAAEMRIHSNKPITDETENILRVEYKLNKTALKHYSKDLSVSHVLHDTDLQMVYLNEHSKADIFQKTLSYPQFFNVLGNFIADKKEREKDKILNFYQYINENGESSAKEAYSPYLFKKYISIMKVNGYSPIYSYAPVKHIDFNTPFAYDCYLSKEAIKQIVANCKQEKNTKHVKYSFRLVAKSLPLALPYTFFFKVNIFDTS